MRRRDDFDPGDLNDPRPRRRGRRYDDEYDDAWAGGDEDADFDDPAGSLWENPQRAAPLDEGDSGPISPRRRRYRSRRLSSNYYDNPAAQSDRSRRPRSRDELDSPSYHRQRAARGEYAEYYEKPKRDRPEPIGLPGPLAHIPFWQILVLVILGLMALLAAMFACVSILTL